MKPFAVSCRPASYNPNPADAFEHLPEIGVEYVEIDCPGQSGRAEIDATLEASGLRPATVALPNDLVAAEDFRDRFIECAEFAATWDVRLFFASVNTKELGREKTLQRLRDLGDLAAEREMTICLETHPDLVTNGDVGAATMRELARPAVQVNFDTANLYFYNRDVDAVSELRKVIEHVGAVHVKDTSGGYREWNFPAIGDGIVDFPTILKVLADHDFRGPLTLEIEGIRDEQLTRHEIRERVARSVERLQTWVGELDLG